MLAAATHLCSQTAVAAASPAVAWTSVRRWRLLVADQWQLRSPAPRPAAQGRELVRVRHRQLVSGKQLLRHGIGTLENQKHTGGVCRAICSAPGVSHLPATQNHQQHGSCGLQQTREEIT